jgi:hypothetical protein
LFHADLGLNSASTLGSSVWPKNRTRKISINHTLPKIILTIKIKHLPQESTPVGAVFPPWCAIVKPGEQTQQAFGALDEHWL